MQPADPRPTAAASPSSRTTSRRTLLGSSAMAAAALSSLGRSAVAADASPSGTATSPAAPSPAASFGLCLNTSTIRGANLGIDAAVDIAAKAGFQAVEPWLSELEAFEKKGGSLKDLGKKLKDLGLAVPSAIGFAKWIVNDAGERAKGVEQMKRDMDKVALIGGKHIAAPAVGATKPEDPAVELAAIAERYRAICDLGDQFGVVPEVEVWGHSKTLTKLAEAAYVAVASGHPKACVLADVYHLHKGGSDPASLAVLSGDALPCLHFNDYPADPPPATITDAHRVYPGDGAAPIAAILRTLAGVGFRGYLSLELFNKTYWKENPAKVAAAGIEKMKVAVKAALG
jgi:2-keto-myo-inositol isomerase